MSTSRDAEKPTLPATVRVLGWVSLLTDVASEMIYPLLPGFLDKTLSAGKLWLGAIEGLAETTATLAKLPAGAISDRLPRRKPLVLIGYGLAGLVRPLVGLTTTAWQVLAIRFVDRLGKGIRGAPRDALIADVTDPTARGRAFGFHRAMDHTGAAIGPLFAFVFLWFYPDDLRTLFLMAFVPGILVIVLVALGVHESPRTESLPSNRRFLPSFAELTPEFKRLLAALALFAVANSTDAFVLLRAEELGVEQKFLPILWFALQAAKSGTNLVGGQLADRGNPRVLLATGWGLYAVVYLGLGFATTLWQLVVLLAVYACYYGLAEPSEAKLIAGLAGPTGRGAAFGWTGIVVGITALPASAFFGFLWQSSELGARWAFAFASIAALMAAVVLLAAPGTIKSIAASNNALREPG